MKVIFGNVDIGEVFEYNKALFVALPFDYEEMRYGAICIKRYFSEDEEIAYEKGNIYFFNEQDEVEIVYIKGVKR